MPEEKAVSKAPTPRKLKVEDVNLSDERIPRNLILMYGDTPYIQKAGLEWKANKLFGGGGFSIEVELLERDFEKKYYLAKARVTVLANGSVFENYGEAHPGNVNSLMQKHLLHLAITRAECRALRMATACGYASYDEVMTTNGQKATKEIEGGDKPATEEQKDTIKKLLGKDTPVHKSITKQEAAEAIGELVKEKK